MIAEVVAIGDELTSGQRLDTNSQWLSQQLGDLGIRTLFHSTVGDDLEANLRVFREATSRADLVICTGGLGPTADDLTRQAAAESFDRPLEFNQLEYEKIKELFRRRGREMPERNRVQAEFPQGSSVVANPQGSAPGFWLTMQVIDSQAEAHDPNPTRPAHFVALPGVPAEMHEMWKETVAPRLQEMLGSQREVIAHKTIHCFGAGESDVEQRLPDLVRRGRTPSVGITASRATITLRVTAKGTDLESCYSSMKPTVDSIYQCLGDLIFGEDGATLEQVVMHRLRDRRETVAVADAVTAGLIGQWLSEADPSGDHFLGGTFLRSVEQAIQKTEEPSDATSWSLGMAQRARLQWDANWGISLLRVETLEDETPQIEVAVTNGIHDVVERFTFMAHSAILLPRAAKQGINSLRLALQSVD